MSTSFRMALHDRIAVVTFDQPGSRVNTLGTSTLTELEALLADVGAAAGVQGVVIRSGKPDQCIAGADLREIAALSEGPVEPLARFIELGHRVFGMLGSLPFATIGVIDGPALGGGLELLLACDGLIAADSSKTRMGLPEVTLGLIPAWGGTQRLPRRIGLQQGLERMLTGDPWSAAEAAEWGLATLVPAREALDAACERARALHGFRETRVARARPVSTLDTELAQAREAAEELIARRHKHDDFAARILADVVLDGARLSLEGGCAAEREAALALFRTPQARNRVFVFFLRQSKARSPSGAGEPEFNPRRLGVVGGGTMGAGIAAVAAARGLEVVVVEQGDEQRAKAEARIRAGMGDSRPIVGAELDLLRDCDIVIEAVPEDLSIKRSIYEQLSQIVRGDVIVATNTSSLSVAELSGAWSAPERFGGLHFFNPPDRMELVEVVRGPRTSDATAAALARLSRRLGKTPIAVSDAPGFLVNRVLFAYLNEALLMQSEGMPIAQIDAAATDFRMPMGPFALLDWVGLDTALAIFHVLASAYPHRLAVPPLLESLVQAGRLGRKSGGGFDRAAIEGSRAKVAEASVTQQRLFFALLLEAVRALEEGVARDAGDVDLALLLGVGFPAARGGILKWCDDLGAASVCESLARLGPRFQPPAALARMGREGGRFHG